MSMSLQIDYPTTYTRGYSGQLIGAVEDMDIIPVINREASASIAFGRAVVFKTSAPTTDLDVLLPATQNDLVAGIVIHFHYYPRVFTTTDINGATVSIGQLDGTGLIPGTTMAILRRGKILVTVEDGCAVGDRLFVRAVAAGDPEFLGGLNNASDSTDMIDCTKQGQWLSSASAGGLAELWVDFINKP